jgi:two-component system NtrC family sensor kinase
MLQRRLPRPSAEQTVLGILDVKMSLASVDARVAGIRGDMLVSAVVMILIISGISGLFIYRVVRRPIRRLSLGMNKVAAGDLDARIDLYSDDEIGRLASTFNTMAGDLKTARDELHEWARTLEERISNKTSELREAPSQIIHMEKMASLGKLSASVAHEINNPLFGILTYSKLVVRELDPDDADDDATRTARDYLKIIQEESSRCGEIVKGLLDFARQTGGEFELHHLNDIVDKSLILLRHHFEMKQIAVRREFLASNDTLVCDARQLQQAIIAPCINALEAMSKGGALTVRTKGDEDEIAIEIEDSGVGIPKDTHSRIFEPFFTTKQGESGLGLGLSVTYGIVQRHRGRIDVESEPDKGTTITITLPREPAVETETVRG